MKKILSCLLIVVLVLSLSISLVACDSDEIKNLQYTDENGQVVTVSVKKTDDPEQVAKAVLALASKQEDVAAVQQILLTLSANASMEGTQNETAFVNNANINLKAGLSVPADKTLVLSEFLNQTKGYVSLDFNTNLPNISADDLMMMIFTNDYSSLDFTNPPANAGSIELFLDEYGIYTKANLTDATVATIRDDLEIADLSDVNGKVGRLNGVSAKILKPTIATFVDSKVELAKYFAEYNSWTKIAEKVAELSKDDDEDEEETATEDENKMSDYETLVTICKALHIKIAKTKGSKVTFEASFDADSVRILDEAFGDPEDPLDEESLAKFTSSINASLEIDAKTMLDIKFSVTANDIHTLVDELPAGITLSKSSLSLSFTSSTKDKIPTLTQEEKDGAVLFDSKLIADMVSDLIKDLK